MIPDWTDGTGVSTVAERRALIRLLLGDGTVEPDWRELERARVASGVEIFRLTYECHHTAAGNLQPEKAPPPHRVRQSSRRTLSLNGSIPRARGFE